MYIFILFILYYIYYIYYNLSYNKVRFPIVMLQCIIYVINKLLEIFILEIRNYYSFNGSIRYSAY